MVHLRSIIMAIYYIDHKNGDDSKDGLSFANRWKTFPSTISRENTNNNNDFVENEYRVMGTPAVSMGINGTFTEGGPNRRDSNFTRHNQLHVNNATATSPIEITVHQDHSYSTGDVVSLYNIYGVLQANGTHVITVTGTKTFTLNNTSGTGTYVSGSSGDYANYATPKALKFNTGIKKVWDFHSYNNNTDAQGSNAARQRSDGSSVLGVGSSGVTLSIRGGFVYGTTLPVHRIQFGSGAGTGKMWYYKLDSTLDLSSYQQLSMIYGSRSSDSLNNTSHMRVCLCTDETGDTVAHSIEIPGFATKGHHPVVKDFGTNLNSAIKSVALYCDTNVGTEDIRLSNIVACPASSNASSFTHQHLIGKNTSDEPAWWRPSQIEEDHIIYGQPVGNDMDYTSGVMHDVANSWYGLPTNTSALYKIQPYYVYQNNTDLTLSEAQKYLVYVRGRSTATAPNDTWQDCVTKITGGWNTTDMSTQDSISWTGYGLRNQNVFEIREENNSAVELSRFGYLNIHGTQLARISGHGSSIGELHFGQQTSGYISNQMQTKIVCDKLYYTSAGFIGFSNGAQYKGHNYESNLHIKDMRIYGHGQNAFGQLDVPGVGLMIDSMEVYGCRYLLQSQHRNGQRFPTHIKNLKAKNIESLLGSNPTHVCIHNSEISKIEQEAYEHPASQRSLGAGNFTTFRNYNGVAGDHRMYWQWGNVKSETSVRHGTTGIAWAFRPTKSFGGANSKGSLSANTEKRPLFIEVAKFFAVANKQVTCKAYFRRDNTDLNMRLMALHGRSYPALSQDYSASVTAAVDTWQEVTLTFTPVHDGEVSITAEAWKGNSYTGYVDSVTVTQES